MKLTTIALALALSTPIAAAATVADAVPAEPERTAIGEEARGVHHHSVADPIALDLSVAGSPHQGRSSVLKATLTANAASYDEVEVRLVAPDTVETPAYTERTVHVREDHSKVVAFNVVPLRAGVHELTVVVSARDPHLGPVGNARTGILEIDEKGRGTFHLDMLPPTEEEGPTVPVDLGGSDAERVAPARADVEEIAVPDALVGDVMPPPADRPSHETGEHRALQSDQPTTLSHQFRVTACWAYQTENGGWAPQRFTSVQVMDSDDGWNDDVLWQGVTGNDGCFTSGLIDRDEGGCCNGKQDVYVRFIMSNSWTLVRSTDGETYAWATGTWTVDSQSVLDFGGNGPGTNEFAARSFQYVNNGGYFARNHAGTGEIGLIEVLHPSSLCPGMCYDLVANQMHIPANRDNSPDDANHEYGHFVQDQLYGNAYWPNPPQQHSYCDDNQHRGLAWTEGFANWFGPRVNREVAAPGANGDSSYSRPWDGSMFSRNLETKSCPGLGDDTEGNVAEALWDLRDAQNDGTDQSTVSNALIISVVAACDDASYTDFYNLGCGWVSQGAPRCNFVTTAFQNGMDYNQPPSVSMTSQGSFKWVSGVIALAATASDLECTPRVEFRVSPSSWCTPADPVVATDSSPSYVRLFDTSTLPDDESVWTCARASDGIEWTDIDVSASHIGIDNTKPVAKFLTICNGELVANWCRGYVTFFVQASDATSGMASGTCELNGAPVICGVEVYGSGVHSASYTATDHAGNSITLNRVFRIDSTLPVLSLSKSCTGDWCPAPAGVTVSASDIHSGLSSLACDVDGAPVSCSSISLVAEGAHVVNATATDVAGNVVSSTLQVKVDATPPVVNLTSWCASPGDAGWCRGPVVVNASAFDALSGIDYGLCWRNGAILPCATLDTPVNGVYKIEVEVYDKAGNVGNASVEFRIDQSPPGLASGASCASPGVSPWCATDVHLTPTATDAWSGVASTDCYLDGVEIPCAATAVTAEGMHTFEMRSRDAAGNQGSFVESIGIDKTLPKVSVIVDCAEDDGDGDRHTCPSSGATVRFTATDAVSGIHSRACAIDGVTVPCGVADVGAGGWHSATITATDYAGHTSSETVRFYVAPERAPPPDR